MAQREILTLDEATPQIVAPQAGDTYLAPVTLQAATGNEVALTLAYTVNKATSGNDTGLLISMTDTASPGTSLPLDIQVGGVSKFNVTSAGRAKPVDYGAADDGDLLFYRGASVSGRIGTLISVFSQAIGIGLGVGSASSPIIKLEADAANILAQRNSTNAQEFRLYNTFTDASNYERGGLKWNTNVLEVLSEAAGTGTLRGIRVGASGNSVGFLGATPVAQQATTGTTTGFTAGIGTAVNDDSTFTGNSGTAAYTIGDIVLALKNYGLLAAS